MSQTVPGRSTSRLATPVVETWIVRPGEEPPVIACTLPVPSPWNARFSRRARPLLAWAVAGEPRMRGAREIFGALVEHLGDDGGGGGGAVARIALDLGRIDHHRT